MLLLTKLFAIAVVVWFYMTAEKNGEPPIKWAAIGLVGYIISWFLIDLSFDSAFSAITSKRTTTAFILGQLPALGGLAAALLIRKKMLSNISANK